MSLTDAERVKLWRKNNPEKIKTYLMKSKEHRRKWSDKYYEDHREKMIKDICKRDKDNNFARFNKGQLREDRNIRQQTIDKYPLNNKKCKKCNNKAQERHHTTKPLVVDKFIFLCRTCHLKEHGKRNFRKDAVISGGDE